MITVKNINSIGWLNCADGSINLTPCIDDCGMAKFVNISRDEFEKVRGDKMLMKQKAAEVLNQKTHSNIETFVVVGRVSDEDDIMLFIDAVKRENAIEEFLKSVKYEQHWDGNSDIYIEFCIPLSKHLKNHVYTNNDTNETCCIEN
ncbi:MAG: hypothetical protein V7749_00895 [Cocleimonas sp.]